MSRSRRGRTRAVRSHATDAGRGRRVSESQAAKPPVQPSRLPLLLVGGLIVAAVGLAILLRGLPTGSAGGQATLGSAGPASSAGLPGGSGTAGLVSGRPLPVFDSEASDSAVGREIPKISAPGLDGELVSISPGDGRPKVLLFLAHWCPHCQVEVPVVQAWLDDGRAPGAVDLYAVATGNDPRRPNYPAQAWLEREGWTVPTALDDDASSIGQAYGLSAFPYWVFVRADGTIVRRATGEMSMPDLEARIAEAMR